MSTIVGIECADGAVLAADRTVVRDGSVVSTGKERTFDFDACGAVAVGDDVDAFGRELDSEVRSYRTDGDEMGVEPFASVAADLAEAHGVEVILAARDDDGIARVRAIDASGGVVHGDVAARGSGQSVALGQLETFETSGLPVDDAVEAVRDLYETLAERDPATGDEIDVYTLASDSDAGAAGGD